MPSIRTETDKEEIRNRSIALALIITHYARALAFVEARLLVAIPFVQFQLATLKSGTKEEEQGTVAAKLALSPSPSPMIVSPDQPRPCLTNPVAEEVFRRQESEKEFGKKKNCRTLT